MTSVLAASHFPGLNMALIVSTLATVLMTLAVIPMAKRRPVGTPLSWGEAMFASVWAFMAMFLAYGVVPHQWLTHADNELAWRKDKLLFGPGGILKPKSLGGSFPFTLNYVHLRDVIATVIYVIFFGLHIYMWAWWQKRGSKKPSTELATSTYGRPLVRKG